MKISIVTPSYNQCRFLRHTLDCVLGQQGDFDLEMLVMDGGSNDGTVELLKSTSDNRLSWLSERDKGQTDALCKGLSRATGDIVGWLNSDDLYTPGTLATVAEAFQKNPAAKWLVGRCQIVDAEGREIQKWVTRYKDSCLRNYKFSRLLRENFICQMSVFWRREFLAEIGLPDISLHHAMDYDLWLRMARHGDPVVLDRVLSQFRVHDASKTSTVFRKRFEEHYAVASRYAGGDRWSLIMNRLNVEKIVLGYWCMWAFGLMGKRG